MEDGDTESENANRVIQDFVFLCRKIGSIYGYFCRYIIKSINHQWFTYFVTLRNYVHFNVAQKMTKYAFYVKNAFKLK